MKKYFYGRRVSDYAAEHGKVDYKTLTKILDGAILNNNIINNDSIYTGYWELFNGSDYNEETDSYAEIFQYYIISEYGANILKKYTDEIVYYNKGLELYLWGVTHYGTSWDYVLTNIDIPDWTDPKVYEKAEKLNSYESFIPQLFPGDICKIGEIWNGDGELPEESYAIKLNDMDYINYHFYYNETPKDPEFMTEIVITKIELI